MKLSEKGENRLYNSKNVFYDDDIEGDVVALWELSKVWEFEPDDFTGAVVLTIEEAKVLLNSISVMSTIKDDRLWTRKTISDSLTLLLNRIEQAEKKDEVE